MKSDVENAVAKKSRVDEIVTSIHSTELQPSVNLKSDVLMNKDSDI